MLKVNNVQACDKTTYISNIRVGETRDALRRMKVGKDAGLDIILIGLW